MIFRDEVDRAPIEELVRKQSPPIKNKRKFDNLSLRFYLHIAPSVIFPFAMGVSDGVGHPLLIDSPDLFGIRYGIYAMGVVIHLGKYQCPPAFSFPFENICGEVLATTGSY